MAIPVVPRPPTYAEFLATLQSNQKEVETCAICYGSFDEERDHIPTHTTCGHKFGTQCIIKWANAFANQSNACPMCRKPLYKRLPGQPQFVPGDDPDRDQFETSWLHNITRTDSAKVFVKSMWYDLSDWVTWDTTNIYQNDLEDGITSALWWTATAAYAAYYPLYRPFPNGLFVNPVHWQAVVEVAKDMIKAQYEQGLWKLSAEEAKHIELDEREAVLTWIPKMTAAVGWELDEE
jgi:hypothetical protein